MSSEAGSHTGTNDAESAPRAINGPHGLLFAPDVRVWNEARKLVSEKNFRVDDLSICALQDPVLVIELLKVSNAMYFGVSRQAICSVKTAIQRLGSEEVNKVLTELKERPPFEDEAIAKCFEEQRSRTRRIGIVAKLISAMVSQSIAEEVQAAGCLLQFGELLAIGHFGPLYVRLLDSSSRASVNYKLSQEHKFDVDKMGVNYLQRNGIPELIISILDREGAPKAATFAIAKPICYSAAELVEAWDADRWNKLAPGKKVAPKSAIRLLGLNDNQYLKLYERVTEYLFTAKQIDMAQSSEQHSFAEPADARPTIEISLPELPKAPERTGVETGALEDEIFALLGGLDLSAPATPAATPATPAAAKPLPNTRVSGAVAFKPSAPPPRKEFEPKVTPPNAVKKPEGPVLRTPEGNRVVGNVSKMFTEAKSSEEVLTSLLGMLVDGGPFKKTALIVVSKDRKNAIVVAARGENIGNGQKVELDDPLSPLAQSFSKVQSFGTRSNEASPFGSKAFALAPLAVDHDTPVSLYADCGNDASLTFEARRIFRTVVELLNKKLPEMPGGIPIEIAES